MGHYLRYDGKSTRIPQIHERCLVYWKGSVQTICNDCFGWNLSEEKEDISVDWRMRSLKEGTRRKSTGRGQLKYNGTSAETRFNLSAK